jgi:hypothetical protein
MPSNALNFIADPVYCHINSIHVVKTIEHSLHMYIQSFLVVIEKCNSTELQLFLMLLFLVINYIFSIENKEDNDLYPDCYVLSLVTGSLLV